MRHVNCYNLISLLILVLLTSCTPFGDGNVNLFSSKIIVNDHGMSASLSESPAIEWNVSRLDENNVQYYEVSLGTTPGQSDQVSWVNVGRSRTHKFIYDFNPSTTYYVNVRYFDAKNGVVSEPFSSSGFITPASKVVSVAMGSNHTCAIDLRNKIKCWGSNSSGQLGYDDIFQRGHIVGSMALLNTIDVGLGRTVKSMALGDSHTCVILDNDFVKCWGANNSGQLGYDDTANRGNTAASMMTLGYVDLGVGRTAKSISAGGSMTCVILDNDQLKCWGNNAYGQLGYDDATSRGNVPGSMAALGYVNLGAGRTAKSVSVGSIATCALLDNDQVKCWGYNTHGQLGVDDNVHRGNVGGHMAALGYINLGPGRTAKKVQTSGYHTCAILDNDEVKCWGYNANGGLGVDDNVHRGNVAGHMAALGYINLGPGRTAKQISLGIFHTCVILDNNETKCWGDNFNGTLGYDDTINRGNTVGSMAALSYVNLGSGRTVKSLASASRSNCAILDNDTLKCWGANGNGQLGYDDMAARGPQGPTESFSTLPYVDLGVGVTATFLSSGWHSNCVITTLGHVKCWGQNSNGQLGYDDTDHRGDAPGEMAALGFVDLGVGRTAKFIDTQVHHTCAILDNDQIKCWGHNGSGQLGMDDTTDRGHAPGTMATVGYVDLGPGHSAKSLVLGRHHTCAILDTDQVKCWGYNANGQLGYDDTTNRGNVLGSMAALGYVNLGPGRTAKQLTAGNFKTCAILDNDQVKCWGQNNVGQLGYDDTVQRGHLPGDMAALGYVNLGVGRTAKYIHSDNFGICALLDNDQIKCWGEGTSGQLGNDIQGNQGGTLGSMAAQPNVILGVGRTAKTVDYGWLHACAVMDNDQIKCWGANNTAQLGTADMGTRGNRTGSMDTAYEVDLGPGRSAQWVTTGDNHTCALLDNGQVKCWGFNTMGQQGYNDTVTRYFGQSITLDSGNNYVP